MPDTTTSPSFSPDTLAMLLDRVNGDYTVLAGLVGNEVAAAALHSRAQKLINDAQAELGLEATTSALDAAQPESHPAASGEKPAPDGATEDTGSPPRFTARMRATNASGTAVSPNNVAETRVTSWDSPG